MSQPAYRYQPSSTSLAACLLEARAQAIRERELARLFRHQENWSDDECQAVEHCLACVLQELLSAPIHALEDQHDKSEALDNFARIFALEEMMKSDTEVEP